MSSLEKIKIGLLEFGYDKEDVNGLQVIENLTEYVSLADKLNFSRFWLTEHHNFIARSSWSSPEILIPVLLGITERIKIGMAGVLINYHSPYRVALAYKLLENIYPTRVDLGFANGTPPLNVASLLKQTELAHHPREFHSNVEKISSYYFQEEEVATQEKLIIPPMYGGVPNLFLLGSFLTPDKVEFAVKNKLNFSKSVFHNVASLSNDNEKEFILEYREAYSQRYGVAPEITMALPVICSTNESRLKELMSNSNLTVNSIIGSPQKIYDTLHDYKDRFAINEFILYDKSLDHNNKLATLEHLNKIFAL